MRTTSGWFRAMLLAMFCSSMVFPVRGAATIKPRCPIVALCPPGQESQLTMLWGVRAYPTRRLGRRLEGILSESRRAVRRLGVARLGDPIVVTCSLPGGKGGRVAAAATV